ncbi:hypothetical protein [Streptomyces synnematoformans]|uniref:hypothetical protein n=1 Tax=Streptomyces synnematoformans TaxID=415721 RepID=UPI0031E22B00
MRVMSFSFARGPLPFPGTDITLDLREQFGGSEREPDDIAAPSGATVCDACAQVELKTEGAAEAADLVEGIIPLVAAFRGGTGGGPVTVAVGCADGQLAATVATAMQRRMNGLLTVTVEHLIPTAGPGPSTLHDPPAPPQSAGADGPCPQAPRQTD